MTPEPTFCAPRKRLHAVRRAGLVTALALGVGACDALNPLPILGLDAPANTGVPVYALLDGAVNVQGPEGFCVDTAISRPERGFAVLATCGLISDIATVPAIEGLITVQIGAEGSAVVTGSEETMRDLLGSGPGVQLLATNGRPDSITIDRIDTRPGLVVVHFTDTAAPVVPGLEQLEWRAFLDLDGRLATIAVRGFARSPLRVDSGLLLLDQAVYALQAANRDGE